MNEEKEYLNDLSNLNNKERILYSIAISLKRIADCEAGVKAMKKSITP